MNGREEVKTLHCMEHTLTKQGKASAAIHRSLDELQLCHMPLDHSVVDWPGQTSLYRFFVLFYPSSKGLSLRGLGALDTRSAEAQRAGTQNNRRPYEYG